MRKFWLSVFTLTFVLCASAVAQQQLGGPGNTQEKPLLGLPDNTFSLNVPNFATRLKQGEAKLVGIDLRRGKNFDQDVKLSFENLPKGMSIEPAQPVIKHGEKGTTFTVKVLDDAALGDFTIKVKGHPEKGADALNEFKITVSQP